MATAKPAKDEAEAKAIDSSNLDPDELAKAIEKSVAGEVKPTKKPPAKAAPKSPPAAKPEPKPKPSAEAKAENSEDKGVPIIVKRRSGYVAPPAAAATAATADSGLPGDKPLEPPSKTQKTLDPKPAEPPATAAATTAATTADQPAKPPMAASTDEAPSQTQPAPADKDQPPKPAAAAPAGAKDPTEPQKPTVFDTTEYHLPIKAHSRKYINSAVSWVVLLLVLAVAAGYVLYRLGVIQLGDLTVN